MRKRPPPPDSPRTLDIGLRWGPRGVRFLVSEVSLHSAPGNFRLASMLQEHLREGCPIATLQPFLDALSSRFDVISSIQILSLQTASKPKLDSRKSVNQFPSKWEIRRIDIRVCSENSVPSSLRNLQKVLIDFGGELWVI